MKLKLTIIVLFFIGMISRIGGQERINREKLSFARSSEILTNATGWANNSTLGEWISYQNVISDNKDYKERFKILQGAYMMSRTSQNFQKLQTRTINLKGTVYFVLIVEKWSGQYEYPALQEDWYTFKQTDGYIFTTEMYQNLLDLNNIIELKTQYSIKMGSKYEKYNETIFLDLIQTELLKNKSSYSTEYTFPIMKSKEGTIRFIYQIIFLNTQAIILIKNTLKLI